MTKLRGLRAIHLIAALAIGDGLMFAPQAKAQSQFEHCNAVLAGDLFNRIISSRSQSSAQMHAFQQFTFSLSESEAYEQYKKFIESGKKQGQKGAVGVNYFGIGGDADFEINYDRQLSNSDFQEKFAKAKTVFQNKVGQVDTSTSSLATAYASYIRDANSIEAWKSCVSRQEQPGLFAFASRDESDEPSINVVWAPGFFASTFPSIVIEIALPDGADLDDKKMEIAVGSGRTYRVSFPAHKRGFQVAVNGELRRPSGELVNSFSAKAQVPRVREDAPVVAPPPPQQTGPQTSNCSWGKATCKQGYVWRVAGQGDLACVTPASRARAAADNASADSRRRRIRVGGRFIYRCVEPYVRRNAYEGDQVCVTPTSARITRYENMRAKSLIACQG